MSKNTRFQTIPNRNFVYYKMLCLSKSSTSSQLNSGISHWFRLIMKKIEQNKFWTPHPSDYNLYQILKTLNVFLFWSWRYFECDVHNFSPNEEFEILLVILDIWRIYLRFRYIILSFRRKRYIRSCFK